MSNLVPILDSNSPSQTKHQHRPDSDSDDDNSKHSKKKARPSSSSSSSTSDNNDTLNQTDSLEETPEPSSDEYDIDDDIVLSEVHINPDNGRVDGHPRKTIFHIDCHPRHLDIDLSLSTSTSPSSSWDYDIEIQYSMGTNLQGVDYDQKVLINCERNIDLNHHLEHPTSREELHLDKRVLTRRCNWLLGNPMDSMSSSREEFDWSEQEVEEWKNNGAFIFAADVVYDDTLTDSLVECLEKLLMEPLPKDHQYYSRGRVAYITMEKR
ncbi:hypothetical protein BGZ76_010831 [Entomortierella beljakovae]|nr:hypothetical protein BGZ76_010831 [Entomortierella beljakovae]